MSCDKTGSIDVTSSTTTCAGQCKLIHNYEISNSVSVMIPEEGNHIVIQPTNLGDKPVTYQAIGKDSAQIAGDFTVKDIRLYKPSLHKYDGVHLPAELIIFHNHKTRGQDLLISIPISSDPSKVTNQPEARIQLSEIIDNIHIGGQIHQFNLDLNQFIPKQEYSIYYAPSPLDDQICSNITNIIFDERFAMYISQNQLDKLPTYSLTDNKAVQNSKNLIESFTEGLNHDIVTSGTAPTQGTTQSKNDIYIDCKPVGSSGSVIGELNDDNGAQGRLISIVTLETITNAIKQILIIVLCIIILGIGILVTKYLVNRISVNRRNSLSSGIGPRY